MNNFLVQTVVMRSFVLCSTRRDRFDAFRSFRDCHSGRSSGYSGMGYKKSTNPENTAESMSAGRDTRGRTTYLGILECFVSARKRRLNGMWRRFDLTYTRGSTNCGTQMFLSVVHRSKTNITATSTSYAPAEMDRARVKTMHVILVCTQTFAQLALDRAETCIALMEGMIDIASNEHERVQISDTTTREVTLGFDMFQDTNIRSHRPVSRRRDHMATKSVSLQNGHAKRFIVSNGSPSHKRGRELRRDAPCQCDQSPFCSSEPEQHLEPKQIP